MGILSGILSAVTGVASAGAGIANTVLGFKNYDYMKDMQQEAWKREDTAVQRRMADLEAAGLSKTLAAGSGASTSGPIRLEAPQVSEGIAESIPKAISQAAAVTQMMRQRKEIDQTAAQTKLLEAQTTKAQAETDFMRSNNPQILQRQELENVKLSRTLEDSIKSLNLDVQRKGFEQTQQEYTKRLNAAKVSDAEWRNTLQVMNRENIGLGIDLKKKSLLAKDLTMKYQEYVNDLKRHDTEWYKEVGLPSNQALGPVTLSEWLRRQSQKAIEKINGEKNQPPAKNSDKVLKG